MLKARLYEVELQKREAERAKTEANKTDIGWGIRSGATCCSRSRW
jgi:peptide chain release factor 2